MTWVLIRLALRNLRLHWVRTFIVGMLIAVGAWLVVVGQAALDGIQGGMQRSVVDTVAGHLQIYSADAKDPLELYQSSALAAPDIGQIDAFDALKGALSDVPEVRALVPMGKGMSIVTGGSMLETKLAELRAIYRDGRAGARPAESEPIIAHLRQLIDGLEGELESLLKVATDSAEVEQQRADVARARSDAFWREFDDDPLGSLEFLDNRIAPLGLQSGLYFLQFLGTDTTAFAENFELFEIIAGEMVPPGERGFLFNTTNYERQIKHRAARRFDSIKEARELEGRLIADDEDLKRLVERNVTQTSRITDQLDPAASDELRDLLRAELGLPDADLPALVAAFMAVDDDNFDARFAWFYDHIAPRIRLYAFEIGDTLTLYSQTRSGYPRAVNVTVRGVFRFKGLERSALAGAFHLMDLMSFRELSGLADPVTAVEVDEIKARAQIDLLDRAGAEDALFGGDASVVAEVESEAFDEVAGRDLAGLRRAAEAQRQAGFTQAQLEAGPVPNVAVFLNDPTRLEAGAGAIRDAVSRAGLGDVNVIPWDEARGEAVSGVSIGIAVLFYGSVSLVFLVALVIIINSLLMATTERIREIGTIRAVGAQRGFVVRMFAVEAAVTAFLFGTIGVLLGVATVLAAGAAGVPATSELQFFIYGGTHLHPQLDGDHLLVAFILILGVTLLSSLVPAWIASRIPPVAAMQAKD